MRKKSVKTLVIKFVIPSKENDEQIQSELRTPIYCKKYVITT